MDTCRFCAKGAFRKKVPYVVGNVKIGSFEAIVCPHCSQVEFTTESQRAIIMAAAKRNVVSGGVS